MELLTVCCWISEQGHQSVMDALKNPRFVRRYQILVEMLERGDNVTVKVGAPHSAHRNGLLLPRTETGCCSRSLLLAHSQSKTMTLINVLINACYGVEERVLVRTEFVDLGLENAVEVCAARTIESLKRISSAQPQKLRMWIDSKRGDKNWDEFMQLNSPWLLSKLTVLLTPRTLDRYRPYLMKQYRALNRRRHKKRKTKPGEISSDSESIDEGVRLRRSSIAVCSLFVGAVPGVGRGSGG